MRNDGRLVAQVAAESAAHADDVALALYLYQLAQAGRTIVEAARLVGRDVDAVRDLCCLWQVDFGDFRTATVLQTKLAEIARLEALARAGQLDFPSSLRLKRLRLETQAKGRLA